MFSYCQQVKSLTLSRGKSMEGKNLLLKSHMGKSREFGDVCTAVSQSWMRTVMVRLKHIQRHVCYLALLKGTA